MIVERTSIASRTLHLFIAAIATETNTFVSFPTGLGAYVRSGSNAIASDPEGASGILGEFRRLADLEGHTLTEGICVSAQPLGRTPRVVHETFRDELLRNLNAAMPVDVVLLYLHGAMAADGYDDCEGDILTRVRELVGPEVAVGVELDLHCHFTEQMRTASDIVVCYKEYPHTDMAERAREVYRIACDTRLGRVRPVSVVRDCRMVGLWRTTGEPMRSFVRRMQAFEGQGGVLSVSFGHGFPWGDVAEGGAKIWVTTDDDMDLASSIAATLGDELWQMRDATRAAHCTIDDALDQAECVTYGSTVIADIADNPGGGAPGDSTFILRRIVDRGVRAVVLGYFWDPGAIQTCREAGVGARFALRIGGKCGPASGEPVDLRVTVRAIHPHLTQTGLVGREALGCCVLVTTDDDVDVVLASVRTQVFAPDAFVALGIDLAAKRVIVVKSTQHFYARFAPLAAKVLYASSPGVLTSDFANLPYRKRAGNYWPRVDDPFTDDALI